MRRALAVAALAIAGCAAFEPGADRILATDRIAAEAVHVSRASAAEQKTALARAQKTFANDATPLNRVRLATLLATLPVPLRDDARAIELLDPIADASSPGPGRLAALLLAHIGERQRASREQERAARERQQADNERDKREETMRQQLDALRSIERGILEREEKLRSRQR